MSNKRQKNPQNALFFAFSWKYQKYILSLYQEKTKGYKMDKRFTPRSNEEMLAAVRAFQARQKAMYDRLDTKLEKEIYQEEMA